MSALLGTAVPRDQAYQGSMALNAAQHDGSMFLLSDEGELNWFENIMCSRDTDSTAVNAQSQDQIRTVLDLTVVGEWRSPIHSFEVA